VKPAAPKTPLAMPGPITLTGVVAALALLLGGAAAIAVNWPGHWSYDSVIELDQGRSGDYNVWHPPVTAWLLGLADRLQPGGALFTVLEGALVFASLASLALMARRGAWAVVVAALLALATPQLAIYPAIVWKDVLFAGAGLGAFACLAWYGRGWPSPRLKWALLVKAGVLLALATLARQNGLVLIPVAVVAAGWIALRQAPDRAWRRGLAAGAVLLAVAVGVAAAGSAALKARSDGLNERQRQWTELRIYEIVAARQLRPGTDFPILAAKAPVLDAFLTGQGPKLFSTRRIDRLVQNPLIAAREDVDRPAVLAQWRAIFGADPWLYLRVRAELFGQVFADPDIEACVPVSVGVDGPRDEMSRLGLEERYSDTDDAVFSYAHAFFHTPVFVHAAWALLAALLLIPLLRRRRPEDIAVAGLLAAALTFAATFFAITIACDYRYLYFLDLSALAAAVYVAGTIALSGKGGPPHLPNR